MKVWHWIVIALIVGAVGRGAMNCSADASQDVLSGGKCVQCVERGLEGADIAMLSDMAE